MVLAARGLRLKLQLWAVGSALLLGRRRYQIGTRDFDGSCGLNVCRYQIGTRGFGGLGEGGDGFAEDGVFPAPGICYEGIADEAVQDADVAALVVSVATSEYSLLLELFSGS